jgi:glyoxylase-like metal-dependent hydrolase (beta-lactamase superfamily II)
MREVAAGIFVEGRYAGVHVGAIASAGHVLLVDSPVRIEDGRDWAGQMSGHGRPRYLALLDHHPDRVLGARGFDLPILAHDITREVMSGWPDTYKGAARPLGCEADRLKRITGVSRAIPDLTFQDRMVLHVGQREVHLVHRPGTMPGAIWVIVPELRTAFIGDTVAIQEPPFLSEAELEAWLLNLEDLRRAEFRNYRLISSRAGLVRQEAVGEMASFLKRVDKRLANAAKSRTSAETVGGYSRQFLRAFGLPSTRREQALQRLQVGLSRLYHRCFVATG